MICIVQWWKVILIIILLYYLYFTSFWELWAIAAHLDSLLKNYTAFIAIPYIAAFRAFKRVKDACFGFDLIPGYKTAIQDFKSAYMKLGIPVSLKVHIIFEHIIQFCDKYNKRLGWFSEHGLESSHYDYYPFWVKSYKVSMNHPKYAEKKLQSVIMYNALHLWSIT